ncbi:winged helix-turn-helix domain-containing protein [Flavobacterium sp. AG291]|uniref:winged helix-turn-helix domain-containing protein n=1 Tax=Flavobacterium sp. AG291 TaxID=2184000 RepID=UPI000E0B388F|nr:winged helix-turn-helix domain-containing protein [Flavobacterium sp. AG291]RDI11211.1 transcriptional regulator [Flavobacterium sp. AG291]
MKIRNILVQQKYNDPRNKYEYTVKTAFEKAEVPTAEKSNIKFITNYKTYEDLMRLLEQSNSFYDGKPDGGEYFVLKKINRHEVGENDLFLPFIDVTDPEDSIVTVSVIVQHFPYDFDLSLSEQEIGNYRYDSKNRLLTYNGSEVIKLTKIESMILKILVKNRGNLVTRDLLLEQIWKKNDYFCSRSLDVYISKVRKYFTKDSQVKIENIRGAGFRLNVSKE